MALPRAAVPPFAEIAGAAQIQRGPGAARWRDAFQLLATLTGDEPADVQATRAVEGLCRLTDARAVALRRTDTSAAGGGTTLVASAGRLATTMAPFGDLRVEIDQPGWRGSIQLWSQNAGFSPDDGAVARALAGPIGRTLARAEATSRLRDRSELTKALEEQVIQSQKMDSLGAMAGAVAHDFNNLLAAIMGFAGLLKGSEHLDADDRESVEMIEDASRRAAELTGRLLAFARGGLTEFRPLDLRQVARATVRLCGSTVNDRLRIALDLPAEEVMVEGDEGQLQQAILNIVLNARDALGGEGRITVAVRADGHCATCVISDDGPGMDESVRSRIFEPFYTTKAGVGTGLGLAITYSIVQNHRGTLNVASAPGMGAEFVIRLPLAADEPAVSPR